MSFVADPEGVDVIIEFDRRGGLFTEGQDIYGRFRAAHADVDRVDWMAQVDSWVAQSLAQHRSLFGGYGHGYPGHYASPSYGHPDHHDGGGLGGVAMGVIGGMAAGYMAGEVMDAIEEVFEDDDD